MEKHNLIATEIGFYLAIVTIISLAIVILSFLAGKVLRAHPGLLIMAPCTAMLTAFYFLLFFNLQSLSKNSPHNGIYYHDPFPPICKLIKFVTFGELNISEQGLMTFYGILAVLLMDIGFLYFVFLSLDMILVIRNPFYSPARRSKYYHIFALALPLLNIPAVIYGGQTISAQNNFLRQWNLGSQIMELLLALSLGITSLISLIYSYKCVYNNLDLRKNIKRSFFLKITIYKIFGFVFIFCIVFQGIIWLIAYSMSANTNIHSLDIIYFYLSTTSQLCALFLLPIRMLQPNIVKYFFIIIQRWVGIKSNKQREDQICEELRKENTFYSFIHTSLNALVFTQNLLKQLVKSILNGVINNLKEEKEEEENIAKTKGFHPYQRHSTKRRGLEKSSTMVQIANVRSENSTKAKTLDDPVTDFSSLPKQKINNPKSEGFIAKITSHSPSYFKIIRKHSNMTISKLIGSLDPIPNEQNIFQASEGEGKSGSFFFFTFDKELIIKTLSPEEISLFEAMLEGYTERVTGYRGSLLSRVFGLFSVQFKGIVPLYFMLLQNSLPKIEGYELKYIFDLKGSTYGRSTRIRKGQMQTLKDLNFLHLISKNRNLVKLSNSDKYKITLMIEKDLQFLEKEHFMDYSLLFGVGERSEEESSILLNESFVGINMSRILYSEDNKYIYYLSIIDYLQEYNIWKKIENSMKSLKGGKNKEISAVPPKKYADRFLYFIHSNILKLKWED